MWQLQQVPILLPDFSRSLVIFPSSECEIAKNHAGRKDQVPFLDTIFIVVIFRRRHQQVQGTTGKGEEDNDSDPHEKDGGDGDDKIHGHGEEAKVNNKDGRGMED